MDIHELFLQAVNESPKAQQVLNIIEKTKSDPNIIKGASYLLDEISLDNVFKNVGGLYNLDDIGEGTKAKEILSDILHDMPPAMHASKHIDEDTESVKKFLATVYANLGIRILALIQMLTASSRYRVKQGLPAFEIASWSKIETESWKGILLGLSIYVPLQDAEGYPVDLWIEAPMRVSIQDNSTADLWYSDKTEKLYCWDEFEKDPSILNRSMWDIEVDIQSGYDMDNKHPIQQTGRYTACVTNGKECLTRFLKNIARIHKV